LWQNIRLYSSIGTPLDYWHGVDGFFELEKSIVTFDLTTLEDKDVLKADVLIPKSIFGDPSKFIAKAKEIATILKDRNNYNIILTR